MSNTRTSKMLRNLFFCTLSKRCTLAIVGLLFMCSLTFMANLNYVKAQVNTFSCILSAGISFSVPMGSSMTSSTNVQGCTARASTIEATVDLLLFNQSTQKWSAIADNYNSCSGCYGINVSLTIKPAFGQEYKTESWFVAYSGGLESTGSAFTNCYILFSSGPQRCDDL